MLYKSTFTYLLTGYKYDLLRAFGQQSSWLSSSQRLPLLCHSSPASVITHTITLTCSYTHLSLHTQLHSTVITLTCDYTHLWLHSPVITHTITLNCHYSQMWLHTPVITLTCHYTHDYTHCVHSPMIAHTITLHPLWLHSPVITQTSATMG